MGLPQTHTSLPRRDIDVVLADMEDLPRLATASHPLTTHRTVEADDLLSEAGVGARVRS